MLHLDFETRSTQELRGPKSVGLWNYANHISTEPLMLGWAYGDDVPQVWEPRLGPMPKDLKDGLDDPKIEIGAFNSSFERYILQFKLGITIPISRFQDPQASARYLSLPGSLDEVSIILGLPQDQAKDKIGKRLIDLFSKPHKKKKKRGEEVEWEFYDWNTHPQEWAQFVEYCRQDVVAEREVMRREKLLGVWPLPPSERKIWEFDQKVNDRGIPVDVDFVTKALKLASKEKQEKIEENNLITGMENSNSNSQMLEWVMQQGYAGLDPKTKQGDEDYPKYSLNKDVVELELRSNNNLTALCREVLNNRKSASSTSYKKMSAILRQVSQDGRLRNQFIYLGSPRCGRWSGNAVQLHNMARPNDIFEIEENVDRARSMIYAEDYEGIKKTFGSVLLTVKYNIRTAFVTSKGMRFNVSDLNAIETRMGAWVSKCQPMLDVFDVVKYPPKGRDPYLDFAVKLTQIPYEILDRDYHDKINEGVRVKAKGHRQLAKPGVLQCIYRAGGPGLRAYAERSGIKMTAEQADEIVNVFRNSYVEIKNMWFELEDAIKDVLAEGTVRVKRNVGVGDCIKIDKLVFTCNGKPRTILRIQLPSGRYLHYMDAHIADTKMPWLDKDTGRDVYKPALCYAGSDQTTKQWRSDITSHGGKIFENLVQGASRDVLASKLLDFENAGLPVVLHVHDEGVTETSDDPFSPGLDEMNRIMAEPVPFAPGLPLASDGFEGRYYHK